MLTRKEYEDAVRAGNWTEEVQDHCLHKGIVRALGRITEGMEPWSHSALKFWQESKGVLGDEMRLEYYNEGREMARKRGES